MPGKGATAFSESTCTSYKELYGHEVRALGSRGVQ